MALFSTLFLAEERKSELLIVVWATDREVMAARGGMVDTGDLKSPGGNPVRVRVPPSRLCRFFSPEAGTVAARWC